MAKRKTPIEKAAAAAAAATAAAMQAESGNVVSLFEPDEEDEKENDEQLRSELMEDLLKIDQDMGGSITWELNCWLPQDKRGLIRNIDRSELKGIRDECLSYGSGTYYVIARSPDGTFVPKTRRPIKISGFVKPTNALPQTQSPAQLDANTLMAQWEERDRRRRAEEKIEFDNKLKFWGTLLVPVLPSLMSAMFGRSNGDSIKDLVGALAGMRDLVGGGGEKTVETLLKGMELAREMSPGESKGSTMADLALGAVRELRPVMEGLVNKRAVPGQPSAPTPPQLQFAPTNAHPAPTSPTTEPTNGQPSSQDADMLAFITPMLQKLAGELEEYAVNAADPGLAAEALLAKIPRMLRAQVTLEQLKTWLNDPNWWPITLRFHAGLQPYQAFCDQVRESLLAIVEDEDKQAKGESIGEEEPE